MKGMTTCKVCGRDFPLIREDHYVARDNERKGVIPALSGQDEATLWDAFDCPHCGCQNIMVSRKMLLQEETVYSDHDGCSGCKFEELECEDEPCKSCKMNFVDYYKKKEESNE